MLSSFWWAGSCPGPARNCRWSCCDHLVAGPLVADPVLGVVLFLVGLEVVLAMLVVAAGPGVGPDPTRGLGIGCVLVLVELEAWCCPCPVGAGSCPGHARGRRSLEVADPVLGVVLIPVELEVVLALLVVAAGPGVGLVPTHLVADPVLGDVLFLVDLGVVLALLVIAAGPAAIIWSPVIWLPVIWSPIPSLVLSSSWWGWKLFWPC